MSCATVSLRVRWYTWCLPCFLLLGFGACTLTDDPDPETSSNAIVNGYLEEIENVPYQAFLRADYDNCICGAAIIDQYWLLTARHCVVDVPFGCNHPDYVLAGTDTTYESLDGYQARDIEFSVSHTEFDLALVKVKEALEFDTKVQPIPLASPHEWSGHFAGPGVGHTPLHGPVLMSGAGASESGVLPNMPSFVLRAARTTIWPNPYPADDDTTILTPHVVGNGDSGGPLVVELDDDTNILVGILSAYNYTSDGTIYDIYNRVTAFSHWIRCKSGVRTDGDFDSPGDCTEEPEIIRTPTPWPMVWDDTADGDGDGKPDWWEDAFCADGLGRSWDMLVAAREVACTAAGADLLVPVVSCFISNLQLGDMEGMAVCPLLAVAEIPNSIKELLSSTVELLQVGTECGEEYLRCFMNLLANMFGFDVSVFSQLLTFSQVIFDQMFGFVSLFLECFLGDLLRLIELTS